jgi:hypothetical protein
MQGCIIMVFILSRLCLLRNYCPTVHNHLLPAEQFRRSNGAGNNTACSSLRSETELGIHWLNADRLSTHKLTHWLHHPLISGLHRTELRRDHHRRVYLRNISSDFSEDLDFTRGITQPPSSHTQAQLPPADSTIINSVIIN